MEDPSTGEPVEGALVLLLDASGHEVAGHLTNPSGLFLLQAPGPGTYRVRAERIGYETVETDAFALRGGQQRGLELETSQMAIELEELRVEGDQRCVVRPEEGVALASVWDEARKALTVQRWTERESSYRFQVTRYERDLDPLGKVVQSETREVFSSVGVSPIRSLPAADLMEEGFVQRSEDGSYDFFGPDASVLLSDEFLDTHCFRLARDRARPTEIGLGFEPVRNRTIPDIQGTFWLSQETLRLEALEYTYTWTPWPEAGAMGQGFVEFDGLPTGAWVVKTWWIRMPIVALDRSRALVDAKPTVRVVGVKEVGGGINQYTSPGTSESFELRSGTLEGQVWDSIRQGPLEGATVYLSGTPYAAETTALGTFLMGELPAGTFTATFHHPRLDSLRVHPGAATVEITPGSPTRVELAIHPLATTLATLCPTDELTGGKGVLVGRVWRSEGESPVEGATVRAGWVGFEEAPGKDLREVRESVETTSAPSGRYTLCGLPSDTRILIQAEYGRASTETLEVRLERSGYAVRDLSFQGLRQVP